MGTAESERKSWRKKLNKLTFELQTNKTLNKAEMAGLEIQIDRPVWSSSESLSKCTLGSLYFSQEGVFKTNLAKPVRKRTEKRFASEGAH